MWLFFFYLFICSFIYLQKQKGNRHTETLWWMNWAAMIEMYINNTDTHKRSQSHSHVNIVLLCAVDTKRTIVEETCISNGARHFKSLHDDRRAHQFIYCKFIRQTLRNWYMHFYLYVSLDQMVLILFSLLRICWCCFFFIIIDISVFWYSVLYLSPLSIWKVRVCFVCARLYTNVFICCYCCWSIYIRTIVKAYLNIMLY